MITLPVPGTLYPGIDGTGIPLRAEELEGRTGKHSDGSAKTREVKLCTVWSAESRDEHDIPVRDEGSVTYSAAIESAASPDTAAQRSEFSERVWREATRRRFPQVERPVILDDGAPWIWNLAHELFPQAGQIVDRFHALGLCISTGVVEAGCKVAIGTRLKPAGTHWTLRGSNAIIALRCCKLSGRIQDFWERRSTPRAA
jgi:hypothetical protein